MITAARLVSGHRRGSAEGARFISMSVAGHDMVIKANSPLLKTADIINRKLESNERSLALREIDRAWRTIPTGQTIFAPIYARLLLGEERNRVTAIGLLVRALAHHPSAELEATLIHALHESGQSDAAQQRLERALQRLAVNPTGPIARCARFLLGGSRPAAKGWVGLTPGMELHAEAVASSGRVRFEMRADNGPLLAADEVSVTNDSEWAVARFTIPARDDFERLHITADGHPLNGGERTVPVPFDVDGRASIRRGVITGWACIGWNPDEPITLRVSDRKGHAKRFRATEPGPGARWRFQFDVRESPLQGGSYTISVQRPDSSWEPLPDSPLLAEWRAKSSLRTVTPLSLRSSRKCRTGTRATKAGRRPISVIIPVYKDRDKTLACINAVCQTAGGIATSIIVVDDATPEDSLATELDALADSGQITLLRNPVNLGFPASVNRAMALHDEHDVVLVNSDVLVFHDWLERLNDVAYREPRTGTVTPLTDDDSIVGYSAARADVDAVSAAETLDRFVAHAHDKLTAKLPVGVGCCLYIRRDCLREVGLFDEVVFDRGYGEEADFCMRAARKKWRHLLAADVFVHHEGQGSFGTRRPALLDRSQRLLNIRHPGYDRYVRDFALKNPLHPFRRNMDLERLRSDGRRVVLVVTLALTGGVERFVAEQCRRIRAEGRLPLVLCPHELGPEACVLLCQDLNLEHLSFQIPQELPELRQSLASLQLHAIELHHFLGLDPRLIAAIRQLGAPYDAYLHDYAWICPRITLTNGKSTYCGEPRVSTCERCVQRNGSDLFESISVRALRRRSARWLTTARRVLAPSRDTADRFRRYMPEITIDVVPHETFVVAAPKRPASDAKLIRIAVLGAIGQHKGYNVLLDCARDAARRKLDLEFVVIGYTENDTKLTRTNRVFVTGPYAEGEIAPLLHRERPNAVFLPSVWPETWCFTLSDAIRSGLPVIAFDIGAIAERLRAEGIGTLLELGLSPRAINNHLVSMSN